MDFSLINDLVESKQAAVAASAAQNDLPAPPDSLERSVCDLLEGAKGRLSAAALFSLRAALLGAVAELRRHQNLNQAI